MAIERGKPAGVSGHIQALLNNNTNSQISYACDISNWDYGSTFPLINRSGRGVRPKYRLGDLSGRFEYSGKVQLASPPSPFGQKYNHGTLTLSAQIAENGNPQDYIKLPIIIDKQEFSFDEKTKDTWNVSGTGMVSGTTASMTWMGNLVTLNQPAANNQQMDQGLSKTVDPLNNISSATQRFDYEGIADNDTAEFLTCLTIMSSLIAPIEGLKIHSSHFTRTDSIGGQIAVDWRQKDTDDDINFPSTSASRASDRPFIDHDAYRLDSTANTFNFANQLWAQFQSVAYADGLTVRPLSDGGTINQYAVVYEYNNPGATVSGQTWGGGREVSAIVGTTSGTAQMFALTNVQYGTLRQIQFSKRTVYGSSIRRFILFRQLTGSTIPEQFPSQINGVNMPLIGQTNGTTFLGIGVGKVLYEGPRYKVNIGLASAGNFPIAIGYQFYSDSLGIVDGVPDILFSRPYITFSSDTATQPHWMNVSAMSLSADIIVPSTASFNAFTSGI